MANNYIKYDENTLQLRFMNSLPEDAYMLIGHCLALLYQLCEAEPTKSDLTAYTKDIFSGVEKMLFCYSIYREDNPNRVGFNGECFFADQLCFDEEFGIKKAKYTTFECVMNEDDSMSHRHHGSTGISLSAVISAIALKVFQSCGWDPKKAREMTSDEIYEIVEPYVQVFIFALRDFGYNVETFPD